MVKVLIGDIFDSRAQTLVNTVNCVGVMGKGIALGFKKRFPAMFRDYEDRCRRGEVKLGRPYLYKSLTPPWILNFPTKDHWRSTAKLEDIAQGFEYVLEHYEEWGVESLAVPPLGCGEGGLDWRIVGRTLYRYLSKMDIPVELYAPYGTPQEELQLDFLGERMLQAAGTPARVKAGWVALVSILKRIEDQPYHWPIGRTSFQKIAYLATDEGIPTGLRHERGSYGPFSRDVKRVVSSLVNNGLIREERLGSMLAAKVGPTYEDARATYADELKRWEPAVGKVADLFMRTKTQQAELVATVVFTARALQGKKRRRTEREVVDAVMEWKQRRKPALDRDEVALTVRNLAALGWLSVRASSDLLSAEAEALEV